jgi:hypothetical protein
VNPRTALFAGLILPWFNSSNPAFAQGTTFTYQGRFTENGMAFTGNAEFQATLWNAPNGGAALATNNLGSVVVPVTNGLFVLPLDFGANFPGDDRWLQLEVRTVVGPFTTLSPRQRLTAAPYAITAGNLSGPVPDAQLAANIARTNQVWLLGGNTGTTPGTHFLGTGDGQPLELRAAGVGIGTNNPTAALHVAGSESNGTNAAVKIFSSTSTLMLDGDEIDSTAALHLNFNRPNNVSLAYGGGSVGIGTTNPTAGFRLEVNGRALMAPGGLGGTIQFGTPNGETGLTIGSGPRADLRFDGSAIKLVAGSAGGPPSSANGIAVNTSGDVGIGTVSPGARLHVDGTLRVDGHTTVIGNLGISDNATISGFFILTRSFVTVTNGMTLVPTTSFMRLNGSGLIALDDTVAIANGAAIGSILILQGGWGDRNTSGLQIFNNANVRLGQDSSGATVFSRFLAEDSTLTLIWDGQNWVELSHSHYRN